MMSLRETHIQIIAPGEKLQIGNSLPRFEYFFRAHALALINAGISPCGDKNAQHPNETTITLLFIIPVFSY